MLELANINKRYNERQILKNVSEKFNRCGLVFLLGDSGAGKTSLLNIIGMLDLNFEGKVIYKNEILNSQNKSSIQQYHQESMGIIYQDYNLLDYLTVKENIKLAVSLSGKSFNPNQYESIIQKLKIKHIENNKADQLSGGEKQRVAIARILCRDNEVILADEPTGNLDKENSETIFKILKDLATERLVIVVTHNEEAALTYGDMILKLSNGEILEKKIQGYDHNSNLIINPQNRKKKSRYLSLIFQLTQKYIKKNISKIAPAIIMMTICLTMIGLFSNAYTSINQISTIIDKSIMESDKLTITDDDSWRGYFLLDKNFISEVSQTSNVTHSIPYYKESLLIEQENAEETLCLQYNVIDYHDMFKNRYEDLEGRVPEKQNEILIDIELSKILFPNESCIGKTITFKTISDQTIECNIVGYRKQSDPLGKKVCLTKELADTLSQNLITLKYQSISFKDYLTYNGEYAVQVWSKEDHNNYKIVSGKNIKAKDEILLDVEMVNEYLEFMGQETNYSMSQLKKGEISKKDLSYIYDNEIYLSEGDHTNIKKVKIVGLAYYENTENLDVTIILGKNLIESLNQPLYNSLDIYVDSVNQETLNNLYKVFEKYGYKHSSSTGELGLSIHTKMSVVLVILLILMFILLFVTITTLHYVTKVILNHRIYEVGVEKSMGAKKSFISLLFITHNMWIGIIAGILSVVLIAIITGTGMVQYNGIRILDFQIIPCLLALSIGVLISILSGISEIIKITKKSPIDCINKR